MSSKKIYLDNNATTQIAPEIEPAFIEALHQYGNPSSVHWAGRQAKRLLNESREQVAQVLHAPESSTLFTSGGTESLNAALLGVFFPEPAGKHLIVSAVEHPAVLATAKYLTTFGVELTYIKTGGQGRLDLEQIKAAIRPETKMIAVMFANNEIGNLYPVKAIGEIAREHGVYYLCDATQALGKLPIDLEKLPIDFLSASAHKFHGPKGVGLLYIHPQVQDWTPLLHGGGQERGKRAGTENLPGMVGMAAALSLADQHLEANAKKVGALRDRLAAGLCEKFPDLVIHGDMDHRLFNTLNFRIPGVSGETLLMNLDMAGIAASVGSACESGSLEPSHVLLAMGLDSQAALGGLRLSLSRYNTEAEVDRVVEVVGKLCQK